MVGGSVTGDSRNFLQKMDCGGLLPEIGSKRELCRQFEDGIFQNSSVNTSQNFGNTLGSNASRYTSNLKNSGSNTTSVSEDCKKNSKPFISSNKFPGTDVGFIGKSTLDNRLNDQQFRQILCVDAVHSTNAQHTLTTAGSSQLQVLSTGGAADVDCYDIRDISRPSGHYNTGSEVAYNPNAYKNTRMRKTINFESKMQEELIFREVYMCFVAAETAYMLNNFAFNNSAAAVMSLVLCICAIFAHIDRRPGSYILNGILYLCMSIVMCVSVSKEVHGFNLNFINDSMRLISISYIPVSFVFSVFSFFLALYGNRWKPYFSSIIRSAEPNQENNLRDNSTEVNGKQHDVGISQIESFEEIGVTKNIDGVKLNGRMGDLSKASSNPDQLELNRDSVSRHMNDDYSDNGRYNTKLSHVIK